MAILVTGAFGCIGTWVVKRLLAAGEWPVVAALQHGGRLDARELGPAPA